MNATIMHRGWIITPAVIGYDIQHPDYDHDNEIDWRHGHADTVEGARVEIDRLLAEDAEWTEAASILKTGGTVSAMAPPAQAGAASVEVERLREALNEAAGALMIYDGQVTNPKMAEGWTDTDGYDAYMAAIQAAAPTPPDVGIGSDGAGEEWAFVPDEREKSAILDLCADQDLSPKAVMRQAIRQYQSDHLRRKDGETVTWSGDEQRARDFAGPLATQPGDGGRS